MKFYVLDEDNNKVEAFDKEGVLAVLSQAIAEGTLDNIVADASFISKIKCCVSGITNNVAFVTQNKYNQLDAAGQLAENTYYFITDDTTCDEIDKVLQELTDNINSLNTSIKGIEDKLEKNIKTGTLNGESGAEIELEFGKTYAFNISNITYTLYLRPFDATKEPNVVSVPCVSTASLNEITIYYLHYLKNTSNTGSILTCYYRNLSTGATGKKNDVINFTYHEVI